MTVREYIGARYVPVFMGEWDITKTYEPLSIVEYQGNSYTSRQSVPANVDIDNETYWALTGNYNAQIEAYRQEVEAYDGRIDALEAKFDANGKVNTNLVITNSIADDAVTADKIADDAVTADAIADDAVTADAIADDAVNTVNIVNGAITPAKASDSLLDMIQANASFRDNILRRPLGSIPYYPAHTYSYNQGCCIAHQEETEILYALHSTGEGGDQYITRVDMSTGNHSTKTLPQEMVHPNDITWNDKEQTLVIASMVTAGTDVYGFYKYDFVNNAITERILPSLTRLFDICWDSENEQYITSRDTSPFTTFDIIFMDEGFNVIKTVRQNVDGEFSNQAIETDGQYIYQLNFSKVGFPENDGNSVFIYDMQGNFITSVYDNTKDMETEGIAYRAKDKSFIIAYAIPRHSSGVSSLMFFKAFLKNEQTSDARLFMYSQIENTQIEQIKVYVNFNRTNFYSDGSETYPFKKLAEVSYAGISPSTWTEVICSGNGSNENDFFCAHGGRFTIHTTGDAVLVDWLGNVLIEGGTYLRWNNLNVTGHAFSQVGVFHILRSVLDINKSAIAHGTVNGNHNIYAYESRIVAGDNVTSTGSTGNAIYLFESFGSGPAGVGATKGGKTSAYNGAWL